jgi:anti-sigma B factor antagonist
VPEELFPVLWSGRTAIVRLPAEVDITIADDLREALLSVLNQSAVALVVDMTLTTFCDSAGITALTRAARRATASSAKIRLAATALPVLRVFSLVGIDRVIDVYPSAAAALASLPSGMLPEPRDHTAGAGPAASADGGLSAYRLIRLPAYPLTGLSADGHGEPHGHAVRSRGDGDVIADLLEHPEPQALHIALPDSGQAAL